MKLGELSSIMTDLQRILWQRIALVAGALVLAGVTCALTIFGYDAWIKRNGWCEHTFPDGKQRILYGDDCKNLPNLGFQYGKPDSVRRIGTGRSRVRVEIVTKSHL